MTVGTTYITEQEKREYLLYHTPQDCINNFEEGIKSLRKTETGMLQGKKLVCGGMMAFDKGISNFLNHWNEEIGDLVLLSEVTAQFRRYTGEKIKFPFICTPHLLAKEIVILGMPMPVTKNMKFLAMRKKYLNLAVKNMEAKYQKLGEGYALNWSWYAYRYCVELLKKIKPSEVILWNEFYPFHQILRGCCKERRIPVRYMEFGCLPGTICIEKKGQQGESLVARKYKTFRRQKVTQEELVCARQTLVYLKNTGLNRNEQPAFKAEMKKLKYWKPERKTILFIGQNDYESGMYPYTRKSRKCHSPVFHSTLECLEHLRILSEKLNCNLIYKPHPLVETAGRKRNKNMQNIDVLTEVDINDLIDKVNLVVTILSQGAYISLIRDKPVVILGYSQLKGKGCVYEAFKKEEITQTVETALTQGYTRRQKEIFEFHTAQLLKYYLYDDLCPRPLRFGKEIRKWKENKDNAFVYKNGSSERVIF